MSQPAGKIAISIRKADDEGLFMAGPYGKLARRVGKKPVMFMNLITYTSAGAYFTLICYFHEIFDVRFIYLTPLFDIFSGRYVMFSSFIYTYTSVSIDQKRLWGFHSLGLSVLTSPGAGFFTN
ncbi:hypothetical protein IFR04_002208 [Cadophora malorum]|uniref:Uncharacterized protein n=1 Tax=Cadophora malorum TaxID=108018 RepID=A0A8H7WH17_9HELO|nr:hypothetical protein IFR04_002208 [Cadophora malorum]